MYLALNFAQFVRMLDIPCNLPILIKVYFKPLLLIYPACRAGFFLTPAAKKTKTQAENSSQKLKEKTQPQGGTVLFLKETQEKNSILPKKF